MTLKIEKRTQRGWTVFALSGRLQAEHVAELKRLIDFPDPDSNIVVDLKEVRLADRAAVRFLAHCALEGIQIENCPAYIRDWMEKEGKQ